jgi:hypothetical protein
MMNNMKSKRERSRDNRDTDLRDLTTCLCPQESAAIFLLFNDLGLQHNIFIEKP